MNKSLEQRKKESVEESENSLFDAFLSLGSRDECRHFFRDICTPKEMKDLAERWLAARLLDEGELSYRDIHKLTGISVTTVGRVARFLKQEDYKGYRIVLDRKKRRL